MSVTEGEFTDTLLTEAQAAKVASMAVRTLRDHLAEGQGPWTLWRSDVQRWARAQRAGEPGRRRL